MSSAGRHCHELLVGLGDIALAIHIAPPSRDRPAGFQTKVKSGPVEPGFEAVKRIRMANGLADHRKVIGIAPRHGAEHILHRFTTRLWSWRDDFGSESDWAVRLGEMVAARGADELWPLVATQ